VTPDPEQIGFADALMETLTFSCGFTVIVIAFEVAGLPEVQVAFEVSIQVTISLLTSDELVKVLLFVPTLEPFTFH
jgi:hypothetical protein